MMLVIIAQCYENYGDSVKPYWKPKGATEYKILNFPVGVSVDSFIEDFGNDICMDDDYTSEIIIATAIRDDNYLSEFEENQLQYDGAIHYPEPTFEYADVVNKLIGELNG